MQLVSKLNSYQMQVEKLALGKLSLSVKLQDATSSEVLEHKALIEQEPLKEVYHGWEKEKSQMANALEELRTQLQAEAEQRDCLLHELEIKQQKLHERIEERENTKKEAFENQLVRNELAELKLILDEANTAKEQIRRDYESYKLETGSSNCGKGAK
ncbi:hypothetical protein KI387_039071 [Taxus chinensis]|uniref:Uncharacterized protein n=1 Tax=Taxus chinensis TaxID=29808 RepID=A0AA38CB30_TAXCH|nr:hypothetical protein KI387_039071 [Taxus chinensis]